MIRVTLPLADVDSHKLPFYLALEEWVALSLPDVDDGYFFTWQVDPSVIAGRNQQIPTEVNLGYCRRRGISVWRRKSGGGCVFADRNNIMVSHIAPSADINAAFAAYANRVAQALKSMGYDARVSGRNDITIRGAKVSGGAFYLGHNHSIVHSTMLYDTDFEALRNAITPSRAKLESNGVVSVESRITTIKAQRRRISLPDFRAELEQALCSGEVALSPDHVKQVEEIERGYYAPKWLNASGRRHASHQGRTISRRIDGVGSLDISLSLTPDGRIGEVDFGGDFFHTGSHEQLISSLKGVKLDPDSLDLALARVDVPSAIKGLSASALKESLLSITN